MNSPDYVLRVYRIDPDFRTSRGGFGTVQVESFISLRDPDRWIHFPIVAEAEFYPGTTIPVDTEIVDGRLLTGGDFDIEWFREAPTARFGWG